jgi:molybdopterin/thiamine biosynthesis adenylyltransferase/rhodanese-related sulfurtransferase
MHNERYSRQILLKNFGIDGQQKLSKAKVLVIGAGGLGCPVLQYLSAAGVGEIGIVDADRVSLSNLHRQVLYTTADIGFFKASIAAQRLRQMNPEIIVHEHLLFVNNENAFNLFQAYDYIIDCTDNFSARYLVNDACVLLGKPLIFGAVYQHEGQVAIFNVGDADGIKINYRHLFPVPPSVQEAPDCATGGVLGTLPGMIGMMQATETIKLITGIGQPLVNHLLNYNALNNESSIIDLAEAYRTMADMPQTEEAYRAMNYEEFCGMKIAEVTVIDADTFRTFINDENIAIIDVREVGELPDAKFRHQSIPFSVFTNNLQDIDEQHIVLFCKSGARSMKAAEMLIKYFRNSKKIYSLRGGILSVPQ